MNSGDLAFLPASKGGKGHYREILVCINDQLDAMLSYHCKVLVLRFDLHLHDYTEDNRPISIFIRKLRKRIKTKFGQSRIGFIWCREQEKSHAQHYHLVLIVDGSKNRHPHYISQLVEDIWTKWLHPKPYFPANCYYLIQRSDKDNDAYQQAFQRLSYLAKVDTKNKSSKSTNDYSSSRLKLKGYFS